MNLKKLGTAIAASTVMMMGATTSSQAADITLRFGHIWPSVAGTHKNIFQPWADQVEKESGGRIKVEIYPSSTLAKPPAQYDAVKNRIMDMTATVQGYSANRFPLTQVIELPGVVKTAVQGSCVVQSLYDEGLLADEYADTHPLFLFTHGQGHLHTTDKLVKTPADLEGMRIRRPTIVVGDMLSHLGAQPVGMPAPETYQAAQRGVINGVMFPWEGQLSFRLNELTPYHTEVGGLYSLSFIVTMNKDVYNSLPGDLQQVIDDASGQAWAKIAGVNFDAADVIGRKQAVDAGQEIYTVEGGANNPAWKPVLDETTEAVLTELEGKGLPARKVYARALELSDSCPLE
ncbi:periplasmic substrate-binding transporter [Marinobacterium zhoushanense]|uniref:Periplasmic substrate-binding transporter n=1 Tax=Marinobacterium zhoushanense TaxID=1679163 RepID=A0ABQ1KR02_9GAMM|nr:TRAP transporter substrate-binding protein [Marinobacterium zhoushanense]GGC05059.1 periplasmic substrate-binding transporter [Marinobacterium zhoushanense]